MSKILKFIISNKQLSNWTIANPIDYFSKAGSQLDKRYLPSDKIWRYLDLSKFVSLLVDSNLFFTRLDKFYDRYEGNYLPDDFKGIISGAPLMNQDVEEIKDKIHHVTKMGSYANCWHMNDYENYGMWKSYIKNEEGVAIQTTVHSLIDSLNSEGQKSSNFGFNFDKVTYIDHQLEKSVESIREIYRINGEGIALHPAFFKHKYYEFENEFRVVKFFEWGVSTGQEITSDYLIKVENEALPFFVSKIDLNVLIQKIYVHPDAPFWFFELIKSIASKFGLDKPIIHSNL